MMHLAAAAGVFVAITLAGREKRRTFGDGDGDSLGVGRGWDHQLAILPLHHDHYAFKPPLLIC